jgi:hypothetical protein
MNATVTALSCCKNLFLAGIPHSNDSGAGDTASPSAVMLPAIKPEIFLSDRSSIVAVYCFIKNFIG